jgi:hypothetical protein
MKLQEKKQKKRKEKQVIRTCLETRCKPRSQKI